MKRRIRLAVLFSATALALASPSAVLAGVDEEAVLAGDMVRANVLQLDGESDPKRREPLLAAALEAFQVLEAFTAEDNTGKARAVLDELASQAVIGDVLRLSLLEALSETLKKGEPGLEQDVLAKSLVDRIVDPAYRSAARSTLARAHLKLGEQPEAERLATRAVEDARSIERRETRNGALRAAALAVPPRQATTGILGIATNAMTSASARSEIYRFVALAEIEGQKKYKEKGALAKDATEALKRKDIKRALLLVQAMERDEGKRTELLMQTLDIALKAADETTALDVAKSIGRDKDQDKALRLIIDTYLGAGKPIRGNEILPLMINIGPQINARVAIADRLDEQGYSQAALDIVRSANVVPAEQPDAAADLVSALASLKSFEEAQAMAVAITEPEPRSFAFSRLSKRLADNARIEEARALLEHVSEADDLSYARTGVARALAKSGDVAGAEALLEAIVEENDRDRVLEAIGRAHAVEKRVEEVRLTAERIKGSVPRSRVFTVLAEKIGADDSKQAAKLLSEALDLLSGEKDEETMADIAVAFARLGDVARSDAILASVSDSSIRDKAQKRISEILVRRSSLDEAGARLGSFSEAARPEAAAEVAFALFQSDENLEALVETLRPLPYAVRVATLRRAAELRARDLDKRGWLDKADIDPLLDGDDGDSGMKVNFVFGNHVVQAPAPETRKMTGIAMPDIFSLDAAGMRARMPAPENDGMAHLAILGFSPFSLEAFKLSSAGEAAIHQVQISQNLTWPRYIAIESGVVTLGKLLHDIPEANRRRLLVSEGDHLLIRVPIIVLPGATLLLTGAEFSQYRISANAGAFVAVAGTLVMQDAELIGFDEATGEPAQTGGKQGSRFRPFITAWGGSDLKIAGSRLAMLGYDSSKAFGLTQSSGAAVQSLYSVGRDSPGGQIVDNSFENLRYGYYSYEAENVALIGNEYRDNVVYGIDPHDRSKHLLIALNTAYGSQEKHGIIVSRDVDDSFIVGNLSLQNGGSGLMLDRTSSRNVVYANTSVSNEGDGLTFYESGCNVAAANEFSRNRRAGIKVRNSTNVGLYDNFINENEASGADIYVSDLTTSAEGRTRNFELDPFQPMSTTVLGGNAFTANGNAINVSGASEIILDGNRFKDQENKIFGGDLRQLSPYLLQIGDDSALLVSMACRPAAELKGCKLGSWFGSGVSPVACTGMEAPATPSPQDGVKRDG